MDSDVYFVVDNLKDWPPSIPGVELVSARDYLTNPRYGVGTKGRVFNLCGSYSYQSFGYYVSLLAAARGHRPLPSVTAIQEMKSLTILRFVSDELDDLIQKSLARIQSDRFTLSIYFGKNIAKHYDKLCATLFQQFQAPLLRARFVRNQQKWLLQSIKPTPTSEIPDDHWEYVLQFAEEYFSKRPAPMRRRKETNPYDMAILYNTEDEMKPSNNKALKRFVKAAENVGFEVEIISKEDYGRIAEFDALFIRETTNVHHHTYRFAQRAEAEGLVVLDDPESILKCSNKVYLAELLERHGIDKPKTVIIDKYTRDRVRELGLPCILKQPDSSFSQGVHKVSTPDELEKALDDLLEKSDLIIAQEFLPTDFDWRVGIIDRQPIYVCKYHMARGAWKIATRDDEGNVDYGNVETFTVEEAPKKVVKTALAAANLIGDGLYGVDLKQIDNRICVIEVNDNPSIDHTYEDRILKDELYEHIMRVFFARVEKKKAGPRGRKEANGG